MKSRLVFASALVVAVLALTPASAQPVGDATLPFGSWRLTTLHGTAAEPDTAPTIAFDVDGRVSGNGGCNTYGSQATLTPAGLTLTHAFSTRMACSPEIDQRETEFFEALEQTAAHQVSGDALLLFDGSGQEVASFVLVSAEPQEQAADVTPVVHDGATLFQNVRIFDGSGADLSPPSNVLVDGNLIAAISTDPIDTGAADVTLIEGDGRVLMPGLIDAHWHSLLVGVPPDPNLGVGFFNLIGAVQAEATLMRGFTTVRDMGGPVFDLKRVIDAGLFPGPRIYPSGAMITVTSGHGDFRSPAADLPRRIGELTVMERIGMALVADSPDEVRLRVREQLMLGAVHVKLTAGGGVASPFSPLDVSTFTEEELRAGVEAAENWGTYLTVHAYTPEAMQRAINAGVPVIEHGHLMDEETAQMVAEHGIWLSIQPFHELLGAGLNENSHEKFLEVLAGTERAYRLARQYNIKLAFGTDILFSPVLARAQGATLVQLQNWFTPAEALHMATGANGELLRLTGPRNPYPGTIGLIQEGAYADILLVDGNPLEDLSLVSRPDDTFLVIMKDGVIYKNLVSEQ
jgi:imidazolonepropionase-like amidohydrolase/heat shock protein HslJ